MIFPNNVHGTLKNRGKLVGQEKVNFIMTAFICSTVLLFFIIDWSFKTFFNLPTKISIITTLILIIVLGIYLFRFLIFNEPEKLQEYKNQESDSFVKYVFVRKDVENKLDVINHAVSIFEYMNASCFCVLQLRYGSNDTNKSLATKAVLEEIFHILGLNDMTFRTITMTEKFDCSDEYTRYISILNNIKDLKLAKHLLKVANNILNITNDKNNTDTLYLLIQTRPGGILELQTILRKIINLLYSDTTAFRSVNFLNKVQLLEFFRQFYGLEAIDLSAMRVIQNEIDTSYQKLVSIYSVTTDTKTYKSDKIIQDKFLTNSRRVK